MFETQESAEIKITSALAPNGERYWSYVRLQLNVYWFYVVYTISLEDEDNVEFSSTVFLPNIDFLVQLKEDPNVHLHEVQLVSPSYLNRQNLWKMDPLKEIWGADDTNGPYQYEAYIFVLQNGTHYVYSHNATPEERLQCKQLIVDFKFEE